MEPAKKITERIIPRLRRGAFVTDEAAELGQLLVNALSFRTSLSPRPNRDRQCEQGYQTAQESRGGKG